ncbi:replication-relaxation family protein [Heyndrickxia ginsengihumi]|uniref:replication-relaxation family protein n=1 Tax=Heyndrickxia ginsengihumi TaxID=363870 RepID=UPI00046FAE94|nr:replication-relaxation family protein [Heyndrickxia ginsengihumi]
MRKRDLEILASLEKFKCLERDQIAALHFQKNKRPHVIANGVLRRLRLSGYIQANTDRSFKQYVYFLNPSPMKIDSQKIDHYLMIAQGYIDLNKISPVSSYSIEPKINNAKFIPDVECEWRGKKWFLEFQNSFYTTNQLINKLDKYVDYYKKGHWNNERVIIIGKINRKFNVNDYPFKIRQIQNINELKNELKQYQQLLKSNKPIRCVNGKIEWKILDRVD